MSILKKIVIILILFYFIYIDNYILLFQHVILRISLNILNLIFTLSINSYFNYLLIYSITSNQCFGKQANYFDFLRNGNFILL